MPSRLFNPSLAPPQKIFRYTRDWWEQEQQKPHSKANYQVIFKEESYEREPPVVMEEDRDIVQNLKRHYQLQESFVATIPNGRTFTAGNIITPDNELLLDLSGTILDRHWEYLEETESGLQLTDKFKKLPPVKKLRGKAVVLAIHAGSGYYHWIMEVLPRIKLLEEAGVSLQEVDHIIIVSKMTNFIGEMMDMLSIPRSKIVESHWYPHLQADELIVPSLIGNFFEVPKWSCDYLHERFSDYIYPQQADKKLYITRRNCGHRRILNEPQVEAHLKSKGFEIVALETMNMPEKIKVLSQASMIVAPHGAGLANMVVCHPGLKVVELTHYSTFAIAGWQIGRNIGADYYLMGSIRDTDPAVLNKLETLEELEKQALNLTIDIDKLDKMLHLAQNHPSATFNY
ncbi:MAG: glycosyltransferase family 61 protein [Bacteroidota bacterium]